MCVVVMVTYSWSCEAEQAGDGHCCQLGGRTAPCQEIRGLRVLLCQRYCTGHPGAAQVSPPHISPTLLPPSLTHFLHLPLPPLLPIPFLSSPSSFLHPSLSFPPSHSLPLIPSLPLPSSLPPLSPLPSPSLSTSQVPPACVICGHRHSPW